MTKWIAHIILLFSTLTAMATQPTALECEQLTDPLGIDVSHPRLSWQLTGEGNDIHQTAWQIIVASTPELLAKDKGDCWTSPKTATDQSRMISYGGVPLRSGHDYYWKVKIWTNTGASQWSIPAHWSMGLLVPSDWKAKWIGYDNGFPWDSVSKFSRLSARYFRKEFKQPTSIKKATLYIAGLGHYLVAINGQPIGDQVLAESPTDYTPAIAEGVEIVTGGIPAEYGEKANGVINLTTRSALGHNGFHGDAGVGAARFSTLEGSAAVGWGGPRSGIFLDLDVSKSDRFLDPVSFDNFHNHGNTRRIFGRYDSISASESDSFRLTGNAGKTDRDVTNLPSQEEAGQNERVTSQDWNLNLGYQHVAAAGWVFDAQVYGRDNKLKLLGSPNDTPVLAEQNRSLANQGGNFSFSKLVGDNEIKVGGQAKRFPIREAFRFGITDPGLNDPESEAYNPNLAPYDLTRGGTFFDFHGERTGQYYAGYVQDTLRVSNLTINAGVRYDHNNLFETESLFQPRVGLAYYIPATKTVLRASYDRMFITPEYENILLSSSAAAASIVPPEIQDNSQLGRGQLFNVSERHKAYNYGIQQGLGRALRLDLSYWKRTVVNAADQSQLFNTGIVFPLNFKGADLSGWNARLDGGPWHGLRGYLSLGHIKALYQNPFVGGLFLDSEAIDSLEGGSFIIDHDQDIQEQAGLFWDLPRSGFWVGVTQRYDSGLVTDAGTLEDVLSSPDTAYAAPYLRFDEDPQRIKARDIWNFSLGARLQQYGLPFEVQVDLLNAFDEKGLYNFQSVFGGTHVIPPRTVAGRIRYVF